MGVGFYLICFLLTDGNMFAAPNSEQFSSNVYIKFSPAAPITCLYYTLVIFISQFRWQNVKQLGYGTMLLDKGSCRCVGVGG